MGGRLKVKYEKYNPEDCELHGKQYKCVITDDPLPKDYPKFTWDKNVTGQMNLVCSNMTKEELTKFKNQFTPLILDDSPSDFERKRFWIAYLSRKYNIKPTLNPKREHWLIRLVNDYVDGKISSIHEFVEQYKEQKDETEI